MKDCFSSGSEAGIRRPSGEAEMWEVPAQPPSSPPLPCRQQRPLVLCRSRVPPRREGNKKQRGIFAALPYGCWKNMPWISRPEESVVLTPIRSFLMNGLRCPVLRAVLMRWSRSGYTQATRGQELQGVLPTPLPLILRLNNTNRIYVDALGQNKVPTTWGIYR